MIEVYAGRQRAERDFGDVRALRDVLPAARRRPDRAAAEPAAPVPRGAPLRLRPRRRRPPAHGVGTLQEGRRRRPARRAREPRLRRAAQLHRPARSCSGTVVFAFQIYCDFSGYSDIAIGAAQVMGFTLMENFDRPYLARSISGVLASLAHLALDLVPRLRLHPARRQSRRAPALVRQPAHHLPRERPLARRELDLRRLGCACMARTSSSSLATRTDSGAGPRVARPRAIIRRLLAAWQTSVDLRARHGRVGVLPRDVARRRVVRADASRRRPRRTARRRRCTRAGGAARAPLPRLRAVEARDRDARRCSRCSRRSDYRAMARYACGSPTRRHRCAGRRTRAAVLTIMTLGVFQSAKFIYFQF